MMRLLVLLGLTLPACSLAAGGSTPVQVIRNAYGSTNVTTGAWVQLDSALDQNVSAIEVFDSSGSVLKLAIGASGSEKELPYYILPGGQGRVALLLPKGARLAIRAVDTNATSGQLVINFLQ